MLSLYIPNIDHVHYLIIRPMTVLHDIIIHVTYRSYISYCPSSWCATFSILINLIVISVYSVPYYPHYYPLTHQYDPCIYYSNAICWWMMVCSYRDGFVFWYWCIWLQHSQLHWLHCDYDERLVTGGYSERTKIALECRIRTN